METIVVVSGENTAAIVRGLRPDLTVRVNPNIRPGEVFAVQVPCPDAQTAPRSDP